jgi:hypothetical protein
MNLRERLMTVLRGGKADRVPITVYYSLLPDTYPTTGPVYGSGYSYEVPAKNPAVKRLYDRGLTFIGWCPTHKQTQSDVRIEQQETHVNGKKEVTIRIITPAGSVTERAGFDPNYGSRWVHEHFIKSVDDYRVMKYVYDHTSAEPSWEEYRRADKDMGEKGIIIAEILPIPIQWLFVEIMGAQAWSEGVMLNTGAFEELLDSLTRVYLRQVEIAAGSPAEVVWFSDNITGTVMSPALYNRYCKPVYDRACGMLRQAGKLSFAHYDGACKTLQECVRSVPIDIIEAFTPPPMGDMTVAEARTAWPDKVLSINVPGNLFSRPADIIQNYVLEYAQQGGRGGRFIVGCTENYNWDEFDHAFTAIAEAVDLSQAGVS